MQKYSRTKNSILNILTGFGGQFLLIIFKFIVRTVFIKTLGEAYLGINGLFADIMLMLSLTELGFDTAINYKLYKPLAENDDKRVRVLLKFYKTAYRIVGCAVMAIGLCLIPALPYLIKDYDSLESLEINATLIFILYLMQSVSSYLFFAYRSSVIKAAQKEYVLNIANYAITIISNLVQILILVCTKNFILYTASLAVFSIVQNLIYAVVAQRFFPNYFIKEEDRMSKEEFREIMKDCGALFVYQLNFVVMKATDNMVLSTFIGLTIVGLYSNYLIIYTTIRNLLDRFYNSIKASMGNLFTESDVSKQYHFFEVINFITFVLYGVAAVGVAVVTDELLCVWIGEKFVIPQPFSIIVGLEILFVGLKKNLGQLRNVTGAFRQMWFRPVIGVIINLGVSILLVHYIGIYGVLVGTIAADFFANFMIDPHIIYKYSLKNYRPVKEYYIRNAQYFLVLAAAFGISWVICKYVLTGLGWFSVLFHSFVCVLVVFAVFSLIYRKTEAFKYLLNMFARILKKKKKA